MQNKRFYIKNTKEGEIEIPEETWGWIAEYKNGLILEQFEKTVKKDSGIVGSFHSFYEIDQSQLKYFKMVFMPLPAVSYKIAFNPETMKLVHFYRNTVLESGTPMERKYRTYCFGYEKDSGITLNCILPDNSLLITDNKDFILDLK